MTNAVRTRADGRVLCAWSRKNCPAVIGTLARQSGRYFAARQDLLLAGSHALELHLAGGKFAVADDDAVVGLLAIGDLELGLGRAGRRLHVGGDAVGAQL